MRMMRARRIWRSPAFGFTSRMACPMMRWASWYRLAPVVVSALMTPRSMSGMRQLWCRPAGVIAPGERQEDAAVLGHAPLHQLERGALLAAHVGAEGVGEQLRRLLPAGDGPGVDAAGLGVGGAQAAALGGLGHGGADYHECLCSGAKDAEGIVAFQGGRGTCGRRGGCWWLSLVCRTALAAEPAAAPPPVTVIRAGTAHRRGLGVGEDATRSSSSGETGSRASAAPDGDPGRGERHRPLGSDGAPGTDRRAHPRLPPGRGSAPRAGTTCSS